MISYFLAPFWACRLGFCPFAKNHDKFVFFFLSGFFLFDFFISVVIKNLLKGQAGLSEPTTVTRCLGTRHGVGRAWFPWHASWEQADRMGREDMMSSLRGSHVAHAISVRVRLCPRSSRRDKLGTSCFPSIPRSLTKLTLGPLPSSTYCTDGHFRRKFADREGT